MIASGSTAEGGTTAAQRQSIRSLLVPTDPADAMTAYYALMYDPRRVQLTLHRTSREQVDGFVAVCQTGRDLFVPLVVLRAPKETAGDLLRRALQPGRPYTIVTTPALGEVIEEVMFLESQQSNLVHVLDSAAYRPVINVMVQPGAGPFRFEIRVRDRVVSAAGVNWQSPRLAEMYVYTEPDSQGRGWGRAVGAACVRELLRARLLPLYTVSQGHVASQRLARSLGFRDSGARELECRGQMALR
jgi:hypothetical protein